MLKDKGDLGFRVWGLGRRGQMNGIMENEMEKKKEFTQGLGKGMQSRGLNT